MSVNRTQVNFRQRGTYQVVLTVVDQHGNAATKTIEADVAPMRQQANQQSGEQQAMKNEPKQKKSHKGLIAVIIIIIVLLAIFLGVRSHERNVAQ